MAQSFAISSWVWMQTINCVAVLRGGSLPDSWLHYRPLQLGWWVAEAMRISLMLLRRVAVLLLRRVCLPDGHIQVREEWWGLATALLGGLTSPKESGWKKSIKATQNRPLQGCRPAGPVAGALLGDLNRQTSEHDLCWGSTDQGFEGKRLPTSDDRNKDHC